MEVTSTTPGSETPLDRLWLERQRIADFERVRTAAGAPTPRARLDALVDPGTFLELGSLTRSQQESDELSPADGLLTGWARIADREVAVLLEDADVLAHTDRQVAKNKRLRLLTTSAARGVPVVYVADGANDAPVPEATSGGLYGFMAHQRLEPTADSFAALVVVIALGPLVAEAAELAAGADLVIAVDGPATTRLADVRVADAAAAFDTVRRLFATLPAETTTALAQQPGVAAAHLPAIPADGVLSADDVMTLCFDSDTVIALGSSRTVTTGAARIDGFPVLFAAAVGDPDATLHVEDVHAIGRLAHLSRRTRTPLVLVQDCAGYDPGSTDDPVFLRTLRAAQDEVRANAAPKLSLVLSRGHVLGTWLLGGRRLGFDYVAAVPWSALAPIDIPVYVPGALPADAIADGPWLAAGFGHVDEVLAPDEVRATFGTILSLTAAGRALPSLSDDMHGRVVDEISKV